MLADDVLIRKTLAGDQEAFAVLIRKYQGAIYALAFQRVRNAAAAEEVCQDAFMTAYRKLGQLRNDGCLGSWLRSIALRQCSMRERSRKREVSLEALAPEHEPRELRQERAIAATGESFGIGRLIQKLPPGLRAAAMLCIEGGEIPSEAAAVLGLKPGTLRKRLYDARARLRRGIVSLAVKRSELHLLPMNFAERCVCRCEHSRSETAKKEVITMTAKKGCGCGCVSADRKRAGKGKGSKRARKGAK